MATADVGEETVEKPESESTPRPSFGWDDSVAARPIGFGWDAHAFAFDGPEGGPAVLLVIADGGRLARVYRRKGGEGAHATYDEGTEIEGLKGVRCPCPFPPDRSGRLDLLALSDEGLVLIRDEGEPGRPRFADPEPLGLPADLGLGAGRVTQMTAVDWDGDGNPDLLVGFDDLDGYWPDDLPVEQQVGFNQAGGHPGYDQEGLWRGRAPIGRVRWLRNVGDPGRPRFELQTEDEADFASHNVGLHPAPLLVSWGVTGNPEAMVADDRGWVRFFRNFGGMLPPALMAPKPLKVGSAPLVLPEDRTNLVAADLAGDGRVGLLGGLADGRVFAIRPASRDSAHSPEILHQEPGPLWLGGQAVVAAADLDNDGGLDLIVGDGPGHLYWYKDVGQGPEHRYKLPIRLEAGGEPFRLDPGPDGLLGGPVAPRLGYACPTVVDWTGNGRPDLVVGGAGGEVILLRNDGAVNDPRFGSPVGLRCQGAPLIVPSRVRPACVDWLGSGQVDLIALDLQGFLCLYRQRDPQNLEAPIPLVDPLGRLIRLDGGFGLAGRVNLWAGSWAGSGRMDILVGLPRDTAPFVVPALLGKATQTQGATVLLLENRGPDGLVPRVVGLACGDPLGFGDGCSPCGVDASGDGSLDLLVGTDDGHVSLIRRDELRW